MAYGHGSGEVYDAVCDVDDGVHNKCIKMLRKHVPPHE